MMNGRISFAITIIVAVIHTAIIHGQTLDSLRGRGDVQNGMRLGNQPGSEDEVTVLLKFSMHYDACHSQYSFGECKLNGRKLNFPTWRFDSTWRTMDCPALTNHNRSANFRLHAGDTLTFYRDVGWYDPGTDEQDPDNYVALDTLDYAVELVQSTTGQRVELLDSLGILRRDTPGSPFIHGMRPILAAVKYTAPPGVGADSMFVRVCVYARGDGQHFMIRHDHLTVNPSLRIGDSLWQEYIGEYGGGVAEPTARELMTAAARAGDVQLVVSPNPTTGDADIAYSTGGSGGQLSVAVYSANGRRLYLPLIGSVGTGSGRVKFRFPAAGTYYVALHSGNAIASVRKVTVIR